MATTSNLCGWAEQGEKIHGRTFAQPLSFAALVSCIRIGLRHLSKPLPGLNQLSENHKACSHSLIWSVSARF